MVTNPRSIGNLIPNKMALLKLINESGSSAEPKNNALSFKRRTILLRCLNWDRRFFFLRTSTSTDPNTKPSSLQIHINLFAINAITDVLGNRIGQDHQM